MLIPLLFRIEPVDGNAPHPILKGRPLTLSKIPGPLVFQRLQLDLLFDLLFPRLLWIKWSNCSEGQLALIIQASFALHLIFLLTSSISTTWLSRRNDARYVLIVHLVVQIVNGLFVNCLFFVVLYLFCLFLKLIICVHRLNLFLLPWNRLTNRKNKP